MTERWDDEHPDPLIDACLGEILGGDKPPDLTARILATLQSGQTAGASGSSVRGSLPSSNGHPLPPAVAPHISRQPGIRKLPGTARPRWLRPITSIAAVLLVGAGLGLVALYVSRPPQVQPVVQNPGRVVRDPASALVNDERHEGTPSSETIDAEPSSQLAHEPGPPSSEVTSSEVTSSEIVQPPFATDEEAAPHLVTLPEAKWPEAIDGRELVAQIDALMQQVWQQHNLQPAPHADDAAWCRRVYVRVLGRIPSVEELRRFDDDPSPDKYSALVDRLHHSSEYAQEYATHWAKFWTNVLMGPNPGDGASREGMFAYLRDALLQDKPMDQWAYELISATGSPQPGDAQFNGAVNFLLAHHSADATAESAAVARVFLGQRLQCAQCHDHPTNEGLAQSKFWEFNALLRQVGVERREQQVQLVDRDMTEDMIFYEQLDGYQRAAYPVLPDGTALPTSGQVNEVHRRKLLAQWVTHSPALPQSVVNRMWSYFFGYGFTSPIDDTGPHNPPSHPELLDQLASQFAAHGFHHRRLTQWVALSDAFRRSSNASDGNIADAPERGGLALFSRYYTRQMQPEAIFDSLQLIAESRRTGSTDALAQFHLSNVIPRPGTPATADVHAPVEEQSQPIAPLAAPLVQRAVSAEPGSMLHRVLQSNMSAEEKIEHLFLAAVSRKPQQHERDLALKMIQDTNEEVALQDVWWALLNSSEFILDY